MPSSSTSLRVATYNIRFDSPADPFPWQARRQGLAKVLFDVGADVFGLQEVLEPQLSDLVEALPAYAHVGVGRGPNSGEGIPYTATSSEYNPIFYRRERLELLDSGTFWLSPTPEIPGSQFAHTSHPRIATWAKLELRGSPKVFFVFNTHLPYEQNAGGEAARASTAEVLLAQVAQIAGDADTLITGDFNLTTHNERDRVQTYGPLTERYRDALEVAHTRRGPETTFFGFEIGGPGENRIDYVFTSPRLGVTSYETLLVHNGTFYYSDHAPVVCDIVFSESCERGMSHKM